MGPRSRNELAILSQDVVARGGSSAESDWYRSNSGGGPPAYNLASHVIGYNHSKHAGDTIQPIAEAIELLKHAAYWRGTLVGGRASWPATQGRVVSAWPRPQSSASPWEGGGGLELGRETSGGTKGRNQARPQSISRYVQATHSKVLNEMGSIRRGCRTSNANRSKTCRRRAGGPHRRGHRIVWSCPVTYGSSKEFAVWQTNRMFDRGKPLRSNATKAVRALDLSVVIVRVANFVRAVEATRSSVD